jgi:hypothetical protein
MTPVASRLTPLIHKAHYASKPPGQIPTGIDREEEKKFGQQKLESNPEEVTTQSSVRQFIERDEKQAQKPVTDGLAHDLVSNNQLIALNSLSLASHVSNEMAANMATCPIGSRPGDVRPQYRPQGVLHSRPRRYRPVCRYLYKHALSVLGPQHRMALVFRFRE